jgi:sortase A
MLPFAGFSNHSNTANLYNLDMRKDPQDLSVGELERLLAIKRHTARQEHIRAFSRSGRAIFRDPPIPQVPPPGPVPSSSWQRKFFNGLLLAVEILAVIALVIIVLQSANLLQELNREVSVQFAASTMTPTPLLQAVVLPSGHTPPTSPGGARVNDNEIPINLRPQIQYAVTIVIPTRGPEQPIHLDIPALGKIGVPIVEGDSWDQLKQGVGHHPGSANPGPRGNIVLSAHNDIYGELFRDLDRLQPGNEIIVYTATRKYRYLITIIRIVDPTQVSVLATTDRPTLTLISCYPYMVDNQRIIVSADQTGVSEV